MSIAQKSDLRYKLKANDKEVLVEADFYIPFEPKKSNACIRDNVVEMQKAINQSIKELCVGDDEILFASYCENEKNRFYDVENMLFYNIGTSAFNNCCKSRHGFWGAYTHALIITNQSVILEKYGVMNNFKGIERYDYSVINQAIQGEASNGEDQLELYIGNRVEDFALQSGDEHELKIIVMAINDQMGPNASYYDYNYYQSIEAEGKNIDRILELRAKEQKSASVSVGSGLGMAGAVAKNLLKSGDFSEKGISKAITKATNKQKKKGIFSGIMEELLDDIGFRDLQDEFTEIGNEFREEFGLKPKMTHAERKELEELEEKYQKQELQRQKNNVFQDRVARQKEKIEAQKDRKTEPPTQDSVSKKMSLKEQMELLQDIKNLLDAGVLTKEEFEKKKEEILNN